MPLLSSAWHLQALSAQDLPGLLCIRDDILQPELLWHTIMYDSAWLRQTSHFCTDMH